MNRREFLTQTACAGLALISAPCVAADAASAEELSRHRIASLESRRVAQMWPRHVGKNARRDVHGRGSSPDICILRTDQGAMGWGMIRGTAKDLDQLRPEIVGKSVAEVFSPQVGVRDARHKALDIPLHDLTGVVLGKPVWQMIGGQAQPNLTKIYSGMIYFDDLEPADKPAGLEKCLENARWDHGHGYRQFKIKVGRGAKWMPSAKGLKRDIEVVRAINGAFPDSEVLVDANDGYTVETAIEFLKGVAGTRLFWVEEPFQEKAEDWRRLWSWMRENGFEKTYRADGEYAPDTKLLEELGRDGVVNVRLEDIMGYGFTEWRALLPRLAVMNVMASPHAWGAGMKSVYIGHLAAALGNVPTIEGVTCGEEDVLLGGNRIVDGKFRPSVEPGFGLKLRGR